MKHIVLRLVPVAIVTLSFVFAVGLVAPVYAVEEENEAVEVTTTEVENESENETENESSTDDRTSTQNNAAKRAAVAEQKRAEIEKRRAEAEAKAEAKRTEVQTRLETKRLEVCQNREAKVQGIMNRFTERATKQIGVFDKIATRTKEFYVAKGYTVENYDQLVTSVDSAKQAALDQVAATKSITVDFDCEGDNPLGVAEAFKESLKTQIGALKEYKTAVKNLIVGVKSAAEAEQTEATDDTETPAAEETNQEGTTNE